MRNVREQPTATERSDKPWAYFISTGQLRENKGGDVSGTGEKPVETNMTDRSSCQQKGPGVIVFCQPVDRRPRRTLRTASPCSPPLRDRLPLISAQYPIFQISPEKTTSLMALCRADLPSNGQTPGLNQTCFEGPFRAFVFQAFYSRILANRARLRHLFSHPRTGWLLMGLPDRKTAIGAQFGLVFPHLNNTPIRQLSAHKSNKKTKSKRSEKGMKSHPRFTVRTNQ